MEYITISSRLTREQYYKEDNNITYVESLWPCLCGPEW